MSSTSRWNLDTGWLLIRVGIGSMYFGGIAANKDFFDGLPEPVQTAMREAAQATSVAHGDYVADLAARAIDEMQAAGLTIKGLEDVTQVPHNGCRPRKKRHV